ncbi:MAG: hypothetical protein FWF94_00710 [Oscillospiraceae bacterium]|nr:hypothetical protein [Oscillospiraceae bacterium]
MREILLNICMTSIALCLFKMLIPENSLKKQTDFLVACFFLSVLAFFFTSGRVNFAEEATFIIENIPYADFNEEYVNAQKRAVERETQASLLRVLNDGGIFPEEIYVIVNISDKYSISINEIRLVLVSVRQETDGGDETVEPGDSHTDTESEPSEKELNELKEAVKIVQKEVGGNILISGEFRRKDYNQNE